MLICDYRVEYWLSRRSFLLRFDCFTSLAETSGIVMPSAALKFPDDGSFGDFGEESDDPNESEESEGTDDDSDASEPDTMKSVKGGRSKQAAGKSKAAKAAAKSKTKKDAGAGKPKRKVKKEGKTKAAQKRQVKSRNSYKGDNQIFRYSAWRAVPDPCNIYYSFAMVFCQVISFEIRGFVIVRNSFPVSLLPLQYIQLAQLV